MQRRLAFLDQDFENHWVENLPAEQYHERENFVGTSQLVDVLESPAAFYWRHLYAPLEKESQPKRFGQLFHTAMEYGSAFDEQVKLFKTKRKGPVWKEGCIELSEDEFEDLKCMRDAVLNHPICQALLAQGKREVSGFIRDETGLGLRIRPDYIWQERQWLVDFKTIDDVRPEYFRRHGVEKYRYDIKAAGYLRAASLIDGVDYTKFVWVAVQKKPPYDVQLYPVHEKFLETGSFDLNRALRVVADCTSSQTWPGLGHDAKELPPSHYFYERFLEEEHHEFERDDQS